MHLVTLSLSSKANTPYEQSVQLEDNQQLIGEGTGLTIGTTTLVPAGTPPTLTSAAGPVVNLMNTIRFAGSRCQHRPLLRSLGRASASGVIEQVTINAGESLSNLEDLPPAAELASGIVLFDTSGDFVVRDVDINQGTLGIVLSGNGNFALEDVQVADSGASLTIGGAVDVDFLEGSSITPLGAAISALGFTGMLDFDSSTVITVDDSLGIQFDNSAGQADFNGTINMTNAEIAISVIGESTGTYTFGPGTTITNASQVAIAIGDTTIHR